MENNCTTVISNDFNNDKISNRSNKDKVVKINEISIMNIYFV